MNIGEIIKKLSGNGNRRVIDPEKVSPDEVELNSYLESERKARVKTMLNYYRKKKEYEHWHSKKLLQGSIRKQLHSGSIILKGGRNI